MPGAGKQSLEVQEHIKELLEAGFDPTTIHRRLKVGRSSIYRMKRCLQQHGTAYMPTEMNKKNGRPKVLTAQQELEVRDWLATPQNRTRYLDDLVWLIHDRFNIVCSTTTMSKLKRKWLRVIECEETGQPIDDVTRALLMETHPNLPILHQQVLAAPTAQMVAQSVTHSLGPLTQATDLHSHPQARHPNIDAVVGGLMQQQQQLQQHMDPQIDAGLQQHHMDPQLDARLPQPEPPFEMQMRNHHYPHHSPQIELRIQQQQTTDPRLEQMTSHVDTQLEQQVQREFASAGTSHA